MVDILTLFGSMEVLPYVLIFQAPLSLEAKKRLDFAFSHRWWGTSDQRTCQPNGGDWRKVFFWSEESILELGKTGRIWLTRRVAVLIILNPFID